MTMRRDVEEQAKQVLIEHGLYSIPVDPLSLARRLGIRVHNAAFAEDGLTAMLARRGDSVTLLVNANDPPYRKRFSVSHELGHHFLHLRGEDGEVVDHIADLFRGEDHARNSPEWRREVEANQFAAALLMPAEFVRQEWAKTPSVKELARRFNVSEDAMAIRVDTLRLA